MKLRRYRGPFPLKVDGGLASLFVGALSSQEDEKEIRFRVTGQIILVIK